MTNAQGNAEYWRSRSGSDYEAQQVGRTAAGSPSYVQQERWLTRYFEERSDREKARLKVLDFGCGFGRFARIFAGDIHVEYFGYDFSGPMAEPLYASPPPELQPIKERVRIAPSLREAFEGHSFDAIFTVSVFIHNSPEGARKLLLEMMEALEPGGEILMVENSVSALSMRENNWHAGCWLHDVAGELAYDMDVAIHVGVIENHAVYRVRKAQGAERSLMLSTDGGPLEPIALDRLRILGLKRLELGVRGLEAELAESAESSARLHDLYESQKYLGERLSQAEQEAAAQREIAKEARRAADETDARFQERRKLREAMTSLNRKLEQGHQGIYAQISAHAHSPAYDSPFSEFDSGLDTYHSHVDSRFERVLHIFHSEWKGIRAAAGSLPGHKLSILSARHPSASEIEAILAEVRRAGVDRIVFHGMSDSMAMLHGALAKQGFVRSYLVWHGTTAQWAWPEERRYALMALEMARNGEVSRFSAIRRGLEGVAGKNYFLPQLLNPVPNIPKRLLPRPARRDRLTALIPSWNDLRKNLATNILALEEESRVQRTLVFAQDMKLPAWLSHKTTNIAYPGVAGLIDLLYAVDFVMNVTTIDCHPVVDLEALAAGLPSVRGPLFLDALEDHPYSALTCVENPMSVADVSACVARMLDVPASEMSQMIADYSAKLTSLSLNRYAEFVEV